MRYLGALLSGVLLFGVPMTGQSPEGTDLNAVLNDLQSAVRGSDFVKAGGLVSRFDDEVQRKFLASLNVDAAQRLADVLASLPGDLESLFVLQEPIVLKQTDSLGTFAGKPEEVYAVERLMALDEGQLYRRLHGKMIRLTVAGMRDIGARKQGGVPSPMPESDVTYFFVFTEPLDMNALGQPVGQTDAHSLWRMTTKMDAGEFFPDTRAQAPREDESWIALARPDVLVVGSRRQTVVDLLGNIASKNLNARIRALPDSLAEWKVLDRRAAFWGLRHYSEPSSLGDISNPRRGTPEGPPSDRQAIGITVTSDSEKGDLKAWYFTGADSFALLSDDQVFQITRIDKGTWQLKSNIKDKGDFPFHYAAYLLGFEVYP